MDQDRKILDTEVERKSLELGVTMGEGTDITLQIGVRLFHAHRSVLSIQSPVIGALISEKWSQTNGNVFQISDEHIDVDVMDDLLAFLYTGSITLTPDNANPICVTANFLGILTLLDHSIEYLSKLLTIENVLQIIEFSSTVQLETLLNSCFVFIKANYAQVFQDSRFLELPSKDFKDLIVGLKERVWGTKLRTDTFHFITRWTEKNLSERSNDLPVLLKNIPLEELTFDFLTGTVSFHPLVEGSPLCTEIVFSGIANHKAHSDTVSRTQQNFIFFCSLSTGSHYTSRPIIGCYDWQTHVFTELPASFVNSKNQTPKSSLSYDNKPTRVSFACTSIDRTRFVIAGGFIEDRRTDAVSMFDWTTKTWLEFSRMPCPRNMCSMVFLNRSLYVTGGRTDSEDCTRTVLCYSFATQQWTTRTDMIYTRNEGQLVEHKGFLYAIGGWDNRCDYQNTVERYDPIKDEWTEMESMHNNPSNLVAAVHKDKIYVWSSYSLQMYDPETNVWTDFGKPNIRGPTPLLSMNGQLVAVGVKTPGMLYGGVLGPKHVCRFDPSTHQFTPLFEVDRFIMFENFEGCPGVVGAFH